MVNSFYDVFISHAYENKNEFVNELALALKKKNLKVWYSGFELTLGTSITASVNQALRESKFGIIIISPIYLKKSWAMKELEALVAQETDGKRILLVLHNISVDALRARLPILADRYAVSSETGIPNVVNRVLQTIKGKRNYTKKETDAAPKKKPTAKRKKNVEINSQNTGVIIVGGGDNAKVENAIGSINISKPKK